MASWQTISARTVLMANSVLSNPRRRPHITAKADTVAQLEKRGCAVTLAPASVTADAIAALEPDGVVITNGAGNPEDCQDVADEIAALLANKHLPVMGIGLGLGMDPAMTAGAVISGAYFGDKMSPLSDTTNLAPAMAGTDVMSHVKFMILPTSIVYGITLIFFGIMGFTQGGGGDADMSKVAELSGALENMFNLNPLLLLPPIIVIVAVALKMPAIPGITLGIISGAIIGMIFQTDCNLGSLLSVGMYGFECETGIYEVDRLLNSGGLNNMMFSISLTILAMMFGGIMEETKQLEVIVDKLKSLAKTPASLVTLTEATCVVSNATMPEQYISIVIPGRMYSEEYKKMGLHPTGLSNALEGAGTVTSALIPWNTCGVFISTTLGLGVAQYGPWAIFNWLMPIVVIIMAFMGLTVADMDGVRLAKKKKAAK